MFLWVPLAIQMSAYRDTSLVIKLFSIQMACFLPSASISWEQFGPFEDSKNIGTIFQWLAHLGSTCPYQACTCCCDHHSRQLHGWHYFRCYLSVAEGQKLIKQILTIMEVNLKWWYNPPFHPQELHIPAAFCFWQLTGRRWGRSLPCNSSVWQPRLVKRIWADVVFPVSAPVLSSSQPMKQTHSLQWVLLGEDLVIPPTCEVVDRRFDSRKDQLRKDLDWSWDTFSWFLRPT